MSNKIKILFVCMGNICRSPMAEGVFRQLIIQENLSDLISTDSAGTHAYHIGEPPDSRAQATTGRYGINISDLRARRVNNTDFSSFHYVLAMDRDNLSLLQSACPEEYNEKLRLFLEFAPQTKQTDVPDPYYGGQDGFDAVYTLVNAASKGLLEDIRRRFKL